MKNKLLDHFGLKLLSLIIAVIVWIIVANIDDYKTTKQISGIEVEFVNGDKISEYNMVYDVPEEKTVDIIVKGRREVVERLSADDFKAVADLSKLSVTNTVYVEVSAVSSLVEKELAITCTDNYVNVSVERKITNQLPISVQTSGDVAEGYAIRNKTATPNLITVEGAESVVNAIAEVVVYVDVSKADHGLSAYAKPVFLNASGEEMDSTAFTYDVEDVSVSVEVLQTKELKVRVDTTGEPKDNYAIASVDYQPTTITVVGEAEDLAKVDEVLIDDIDVTDQTKDLETSVAIADYLPSGITMAENVEEIMIKVVIEQIEEKVMTVGADDINLVGKEDGYTYTMDSDVSYTLKVRGLKNDLEDLKVTNMIPNIDVSGLGEGTHTLTVNFKELKGIQVMDTLQIELVISKED